MDTTSDSAVRLPTRADAAVFGCKVALLRLRRWIADAFKRDLKRWSSGAPLPHVWSEAISVLDTVGADEHRALVLGKIQNLRVALRSIDGVHVPAGQLLSFWKQVGQARRGRGYVEGRELREGCIIPAVGGGLCQLSNALYQAALDAGLDIVERHAHSRVIPGSAAQSGRDATVFWNYVDLRFRSAEAFGISARIEDGQLRVRILKHSPRAVPAKSAVSIASIAFAPKMPVPRSCHSCGETACFRQAAARPATAAHRTVFMVDALWPEFDAWIATRKGPRDTLMLPLDGRRHGRPQYAWHTEGFGKVATFPMLALWRSLVSRRLSNQGAARQMSALAFRKRLAHRYVESLTYLDEHVVVSQDLLPYVWETGALQGRSFDVLMTGPTISALHTVLDDAHARHPESTTLGDFRAPSALAASEMQALQKAGQILTPHSEVAAAFAQTVRLYWARPVPARTSPGQHVVFPAPTLGRKGAYDLRACVRELGLPLTLMGPVLESSDFWEGVEVRMGTMADAAVLVLPAWVQVRPTLLLTALDAGIPVIATPACGLLPQPNLTIVPAGNVAALMDALRPYASRSVS
ncbi:hypothetical protein G4G28_18340 [Massilia sp. Dwa41.01b]|uniref:VanW family protein n=2 Tax=unclassified Massilia TaxID=2609279 RepID=UPI0016013ACD|nr:VanW family protein [Massilia sp. Dwa41.01b]QNA89968.1 hypothetical protein G4G28_18340 [Massilia sp. Dwa41.01b]QNB00851.1 hypothetical protein G4G31_21910 [Massilia sp. Se16.2.3]